ncbi:MAG TPA: hypothetical protein VHW01_06595, partial [Polyangiaceae bacterium]|nr:hypothetical protein [Polyangiaceae bacterium]
MAAAFGPAPVASIARLEPPATSEPQLATPLCLAPRKPQSVPLAALAVWSKPGLCSSSPDA